MLAGLVAGIVAFGFARVFGEPSVSTAISFEQQRAAAAGTPYTVELVSRDIQSTLGLLAAVVVYGVALGGIFALVFAAVYGRVRHASPARTALGLGAGAFFVVYLVPFLKYPANPPAVGRPETIGTRTALYVAMLAISLLGAAYALWLDRRLQARLGSGNSMLASIGTYLVIVIAGGLLLPVVNEVPSGFPAVTLWNFRIASIGIQAITWATIALLFGFLATHALDPSADEPPPRRAADASRPVPLNGSGPGLATARSGLRPLHQPAGTLPRATPKTCRPTACLSPGTRTGAPGLDLLPIDR
jgi:uncharacterized membrane protein YidH (DUF202 family)